MADRPISRGFKSRHQIEENQKLRLPPGQYVTMDFPVLSAGPTPQIKLENWTFALQADGSLLGKWSWEEFEALPQSTMKVDIHCVTKWSKLDTTWQGVTFDDLLEAVGLAKPPAPYIMAHCDGGYTTNLPAVVVDDKGNLRVPADYRTAYQMLGSWPVAKDDGPGSKEMHVVYASPGTIAAYRKDGYFPDGTVLVKEVFKTTTKDMTTGTVSSAGTLAGWFVMVKDNVGRFSGNKLWGDGWGWSWFDATNPQKTTSTDYTTDCQSCHVPARQSDWIYTHGYPVLTR